MLPLVGGIVGLFIMSINKQQTIIILQKAEDELRFLPFSILAYNKTCSI